MRFFAPVLPRRTLAPHGGQRDHREREDVVDAMYELGSGVYQALLEATAPEPPEHFEHARITLTLLVAHGTRGRCQRCVDRARAAGRPAGPCECYRPRTPTNFSGDIATSVLDALKRHGVIESTTYETIDEVVLRIEHVEAAAFEGIRVEVEA